MSDPLVRICATALLEKFGGIDFNNGTPEEHAEVVLTIAQVRELKDANKRLAQWQKDAADERIQLREQITKLMNMLDVANAERDDARLLADKLAIGLSYHHHKELERSPTTEKLLAAYHNRPWSPDTPTPDTLTK